MKILYIDIDSLRPDHLGCYGYHRNTSPNIDSVSADAIRFDNCYTSDAPCLPSRTAFYTGMFGIHSGVVGHGGTAADLRVEGARRAFRDKVELDSLPSALQQAGYHTAQISPFGQRHAARQFYAGFNEIHNTGQGGGESAEVVQPVVMKWLEDNQEKEDWYLHINYWDPHTPYRTPDSFGEPFASDPLPEWIDDDVFAKHLDNVGPHSAREISMFSDRENPKYPKAPGSISDRAGLRKMIDGYDNGIRYVDDQIGQILAFLRETGQYDDMAIVISADHGENQGELGLYGEHGTADQITCRVPMIIKWPGGRVNAVDDGMHYSLDFAPTLAGLLEFPEREMWDGQSYAASILEEKDTGRDSLVISQCAHVCQRSVRFDDWLYMRTYHDGYHLFPKEMLYDLSNDPHEQFDVSEEHRDVCDRAIRILSDWHDEMMDGMDYDNDPLRTVMKEGGPFHARGALPDYCKHLEKTGRAWAVEVLKKKHPREFEGID